MDRTKLAALWALMTLCLATPLGARAQAPARHVDDSSIAVSLFTTIDANQSTGYRFRVDLRVYGEGLTAHDAVRIEWMQGGRSLATLRCLVSFDDTLPGVGLIRQDTCRWMDGVLTAVGDVQIALTYQDDSTDTTIPLRTLEARVGRFWDWSGMSGSRPTHNVRYQLLGDDLLTAATVELRAPSGQDTYGRVWLHFWAATRSEQWTYQDAQVRCSVDGQRLPELSGNIRSSTAQLTVEDRQFVDGVHEETVAYNWMRFWAAPMLWHGQRGFGLDPNAIFLGEHPGQWACQIRSAGEVVRELRFVVGPDGNIVRHAEQLDPAGVWLPPQVFLADVRFPSPNRFDFSFQPQILRERGFWGHRWAQPAAFAEQFAAMPPAAGRSEPPAPRGAPPAPRAAAAPRGRRR